ncbi:BRO-N domain-containing protein [Acetobacter oryzoeni]|uniref:Phage antirepressor protein n=1 Tax=Acetobacter oryzoeni TaxID=2500548 RepID=A0A5B9GPM8_9PROT|nr:BRO family protein [Acetobacter oryzoeni]MCP1203318.1 BRO family protein [Acetobacter oryzoeni]QEE86676.1 phage antirepressor protein [Acetobacter oryzoeni]
MTLKSSGAMTFEGHELEWIECDNQLWLLGRAVCDVLEIQRHRSALEKLDDNEKRLVKISTAGGPQRVVAVSESGLYHLTFASRKPVAKRFRRWVTDEVLPQIRRTGVYRPNAGAPIADALKPNISEADLRLLEELKEGDIYQSTRHLVTRMNGKFSVERALSEAKRPWSYDLDILELIHLVKLVQISWFALGQNSERSDQMRQYMCRLSTVMRLLDDKLGTGPYFEPVSAVSPAGS